MVSPPPATPVPGCSFSVPEPRGEKLDNSHYVKDLGLRSKAALERGDVADFGALMHEHWEQKKNRSSAVSNADIDRWYELGRANGALGGKRVGSTVVVRYF